MCGYDVWFEVLSPCYLMLSISIDFYNLEHIPLKTSLLDRRIVSSI